MRSMSFKSALFLFIVLLLLEGCASSGSTRVAASEADKVYIQTEQSFSHPGGDLRDAIQATDQRTKGIVLGGLTGALIGSLYSSIGVIPGLAGGAIIGGAIGSYVDAYTTPIDRLENLGVQVIILGDQIKFVIPSDLIFNSYSSTLRPHAYSTLDQVADIIGQYPNMSVKVAAYTSNTQSPAVNLALSQQQANCVAKYLSTRGVNTRLIYASGMGGTYLVTKNVSDWSTDNYRVEITLEKLPL